MIANQKVVLLGMCIMMSMATFAQVPQPQTKFPAKKWFNGEKGYREALEIQKQTGADMVVYFYRIDEKDEKGLCAWWEKYGIDNGKVSRFLETYIKVKMQLPFHNTEKETFSSFYFNKCPAVFVAAPTGFPQKIAVFDWPNNKPQLKRADELVAEFKAASSVKPSEDKPITPSY